MNGGDKFEIEMDGKTILARRGQAIAEAACMRTSVALIDENQHLGGKVFGPMSNTILGSTSEEKISRRFKDWSPPPAKIKRGFLAIYAKTALQAHEGAMIDDNLKKNEHRTSNVQHRMLNGKR